MMRSQTCKHANTKEYSSEITCTDCGLVLQDYIFDTRPILDDNNPDTYTLYDTSSCDMDLTRASEYLFLPETVLLTAQSYLKKRTAKGKAAALFKAAKDHKFVRPREAFCELFNISPQDLLDARNKYNINTFTKDNILSRFANNAQFLLESSTQRHAIFKQAALFEQLLQNNKYYINTKPSKMDAALFFYAAQKKNITINKKTLLNICNISSVTFRKHLNFLSNNI